MDHSKRLADLQVLMREQNIEAFLVIGQENCEYLIGSHGHELFDITLLVTLSGTVVICSPLYLEALGSAPVLVRGWEGSFRETLRFECGRFGVREIGVEGSRLPWATFTLLLNQLTDLTFKDAGKLVEQLRLIKDGDEIELIRKACAITDKALAATLGAIREGMTERQVAWMIERSMREQGAEDVSFRPLIVATGSASSEPHHVPGDRKIAKGDIIQFDIGARYQGYGADLSRVAVLGYPSTEQTKLYDLVIAVQAHGISLVRAEADGAAIDRECKQMVEKSGYPVYPHGLGHGIGLAPSVHEDPFLSAKAAKPVLLKTGMVITVEPGVYLPGIGGVRIEDDILVLAQGSGFLSQADRSLIVL